MKKIIFGLIMVFLIPLNINAGIICNDGWESSCVVSGPGCCSHHGGVYKSYNTYSSYNTGYSFYNNNVNSDNDDNIDLSGVVTLGVIGGIILLGIKSK